MSSLARNAASTRWTYVLDRGGGAQALAESPASRTAADAQAASVQAAARTGISRTEALTVCPPRRRGRAGGGRSGGASYRGAGGRARGARLGAARLPSSPVSAASGRR